MHRRLILSRFCPAIAISALVAVGPAHAATQDATVSTTTPPPKTRIGVQGKQQGLHGNDTIAVDASGGYEEAASKTQLPVSSARQSASSGTPTPPRFPAWFPALVPSPEGRFCIQPQRRWFADELSAQLYDSAQESRWLLLYRNGYDLCPRADRPPNNPAVEAAEYWRVFGEDLLPKPQPRIQPGYMLTGKLAYLEANSQPTARFEHPTPIGTLVIDATATLWVDWGDGQGLKGPITAPDGPWPNGKVTGFWTNAGTYDVRVVQRWSATWELNGRRGDLRDLSTDGIIENFEVRDVQAVLNR